MTEFRTNKDGKHYPVTARKRQLTSSEKFEEKIRTKRIMQHKLEESGDYTKEEFNKIVNSNSSNPDNRRQKRILIRELVEKFPGDFSEEDYSEVMELPLDEVEELIGEME